MTAVGARRDDGLLERLAPGLAAVAPRLRLAELPTPCTEAPHSARALGAVRLFIKRDDLSSPRYGGTKVRALEFLLGAARAAGAGGVATLGPDGSHHVYATAVFARAAGFDVRAALFPQPPTPETPFLRAALEAIGVDVVRAPLAALLWWAAARARFTALGDGGRPFWIPAGGANALGVLGAVEGALEVAEDVRRGGVPRPDAIVVAAGSCGAAAGILLGTALAGLAVEVVAVRVTPRIVASRFRILSLARKAARILAAAGCTRAEGLELGSRLRVQHAYYGGGYAIPDPGAHEMMALAAADGLALETTYTAKALRAAGDPSCRGRSILFWNTFSAVAARSPEKTDQL